VSYPIASICVVGDDGQRLVWVHPPAESGELRAKRRLEYAAQRVGIPGPYTYEIVRLS
jgi:hypothetical protein